MLFQTTRHFMGYLTTDICAEKKVLIGGFFDGQIDPPSPRSSPKASKGTVRLRRTGGNLIADGRFNYSWDCENRLIAV
jgi:hypothetical protein